MPRNFYATAAAVVGFDPIKVVVEHSDGARSFELQHPDGRRQSAHISLVAESVEDLAMFIDGLRAECDRWAAEVEAAEYGGGLG